PYHQQHQQYQPLSINTGGVAATNGQPPDEDDDIDIIGKFSISSTATIQQHQSATSSVGSGGLLLPSGQRIRNLSADSTNGPPLPTPLTPSSSIRFNMFDGSSSG